MITIFTTPKPFRGKFKKIQENAIRSWIRLRPEITIILMGDEPGVFSIAKRFKIRQIKKIKSNPSGIPYLSALFELARERTKGEILAYVNSDIILFEDFAKAIDCVKKQKSKFLMIGRRTDVNFDKSVNFNNSRETNNLVRYAKKNGKLHSYCGTDYFVYPRNFWKKIPDFTIARASFDRWLVGEAKRISSCVIDATKAVTAIHQNHDYSSIPGGLEGKLYRKEAAKNEKLARGIFGDVKSADYILTANFELKKNIKKIDMEVLWVVFKEHMSHFLKVRMLALLRFLVNVNYGHPRNKNEF